MLFHHLGIGHIPMLAEPHQLVALRLELTLDLLLTFGDQLTDGHV